MVKLARQLERPGAPDGDWYAQLLGQTERRRRGHYSTPPALVERILDWVGYGPEADLDGMLLLDPSCGSGNFLVAAAGRLLAAGRARGWSSERTLAAVQAHLWGLEVDPAACAVAEIRLAGMVDPTPASWEASGTPPARSRGAPAGPSPTPAGWETGGTPLSLRFHVHQVDALAIAGAGRFQVVVGNPPYLSSRKHAAVAPYQGYLSAGQRDAYLLFVEQACRFVAPGGWLGLVLPDPVLARGNAVSARRLLLGEFAVSRIEHLAGVFHAEVGTVVVVAQRVQEPGGYAVPWRRVDRGQARLREGGTEGRFGVEVWRQQPRAELRYLLGAGEAALFERLAGEVPMAPLGDLVTLSRGEEIGRQDARLVAEAGADRLPVLRGGQDVLPFRCRFAGAYVPQPQVVKSLERYRAPKLLVVKSTGRLLAALDESGAVAVQTLYVLGRQAGAPTLEYLLALLNSRLLRGYLWLHSTAYKLMQPQIEQAALARVPVPVGDVAAQQELAALAGHLRRCWQEWDWAAEQRRMEQGQRLACADEAGWVQLGETIRALSARVDAGVAGICGLSVAEQALLARVPV